MYLKCAIVPWYTKKQMELSLVKPQLERHKPRRAEASLVVHFMSFM